MPFENDIKLTKKQEGEQENAFKKALGDTIEEIEENKE